MSTPITAEQTVLEFDQEIEIKAAPGEVFEGMLHRLSEGHTGPQEQPLPLKLERWAGGRWLRDLGDGHGHLWGFVQSIKPPTLIELFGPMFMSYPVSGHLIVRFSPVAGGTKISFKYSAFGLILEGHRSGLKQGWSEMLTGLKAKLEG
ncbi:MAG: SRPBCC domain-containing protein [Deltaproteobacteria bacterium]|nr:SRPBCC domain-containing protein [Deltaproteobacteria bacterium]